MSSSKTKNQKQTQSALSEQNLDNLAEGQINRINFRMSEHDPRKKVDRLLYLNEKNLSLRANYLELMSMEKIKSKLANNFGGLVAADLVDES